MTSYIENLHSLSEHYFYCFSESFRTASISIWAFLWSYLGIHNRMGTPSCSRPGNRPQSASSASRRLSRTSLEMFPQQSFPGPAVSSPLRVLVLCQESSLAQGFPKLWPELRENAEWGQMGCGGWGCEDAKHQDAGGRVSGSRGPPDRSILASSSSWRLSYGLRNGVRPMMIWRPVEAMASIGLNSYQGPP